MGLGGGCAPSRHGRATLSVDKSKVWGGILLMKVAFWRENASIAPLIKTPEVVTHDSADSADG